MSRAPLLLSSLLAAQVGCEVVLGDLPDARTESASSATSGSGGAGGGASATGGGAGGAGGAPSATTTASTTAATSGGGGCCDCDGDLADAMGACQGDDCDDGDARAHPGQTEYFGTPAPTAGYDFDCNGLPERDPKLAVSVDCSGLALPCQSAVGFLGNVPPACGAHADWGTCKANGLVCDEDVIEAQKVMTCK